MAVKKRKKQVRPAKPNAEKITSVHSDFYVTLPGEEPLYNNRHRAAPSDLRTTARHRSATGKRKETAELRDKMALLAILKVSVLLVFLIIFFFILRKGVSLLEEKRLADDSVMNSSMLESDKQAGVSSAVGTATDLSEEELVLACETAERLLGDAISLERYDNIDEAIEKCQEALVLNPSHLRVLERLGMLYYSQGMYEESAHIYRQLIQSDPRQGKFQLALLKSLEVLGKSKEIVLVAEMYQEYNLEYNAEVQGYIASAYVQEAKFEEALSAYERLLKGAPQDAGLLKVYCGILMELGRYEDALGHLEKLRGLSHNDPDCNRSIVICNAQLEKAHEAVEMLALSGQLFDVETIVSWLEDPLLDPIRQDREFQKHVDRIAGEDYRKLLDRMAQDLRRAESRGISFDIDVNKTAEQNPLLNRRDQ